MNKIKIAPSLICCKMDEVASYIEKFNHLNVDRIHFDVSDGHFVKNVMLGVNSYQDIKRLTHIPIDLHLYCTNPEDFIDIFQVQQGDYISIHPETTKHLRFLLRSIRTRNCKAGIVFSPDTPLELLNDCLDQIDFITILAVPPGFAGGKMVKGTLEKIQTIRTILDDRGYPSMDIVIDGNTSFENAPKMYQAGGNVFVVGTSSLITELDQFEHNYNAYIDTIEKGGHLSR